MKSEWTEGTKINAYYIALVNGKILRIQCDNLTWDDKELECRMADGRVVAWFRTDELAGWTEERTVGKGAYESYSR